MSFPKLLAVIALLIFTLIGILALFKGEKSSSDTIAVSLLATPLEVELDRGVPRERPTVSTPSLPRQIEGTRTSNLPATPPVPPPTPPNLPAPPPSSPPLPEAGRIQELFNKGEPKLSFVETVTYKSRVPWQKGRPAWLVDYAHHYNTSRHFIARSLNGKADYFKQDVAEGDRFNVFRKDKNINFHLLIDVSKCKLWLYCHDVDSKERWLLKAYQICLGRIDKSKISGLLTPLGKYTVGNKIAIYKPKIQGYHNGQKVEMIRVFGTRWIPFEKEISGCTAPAKGFGLHGIPWVPNNKGELVQDTSSLGKYESDGCIRLATEDIEEIFAIIITKPATVELVKNFHDALLPGIEKH
jgi:hypothetical protein